MSTENTPRFSCNSCGKKFAWKPEIAGKKAKCKCGAVITVPAKDPSKVSKPAPKPQPVPEIEDDDYGLAEAAAEAASAPKIESAPVAAAASPTRTAANPVGSIAASAVGGAATRALRIGGSRTDGWKW